MELIYGVHPVVECLKAGRRRPSKLWVTGKKRLGELQRALESPVPLRPVIATREECSRLAGTPHHQGVVAEVPSYPYLDWRDLLEEEEGRVPFLLALDGLTDPQNVGAILRSALCAGVTGVTLRNHHAALVTPAVVKASAGASEHLRVALVSNQSMFLRACGKAGVARVGLSMEGDSLWDQLLDFREPVVLVVGAEGKGLSRLVADNCDAKIRVPMAPPLDSLNASVAASLAMFEVTRARVEDP